MSQSSRTSKVIIFDWDDTICPSSFVDHWKLDNFKDLPLHFQNLFDEIGKCAEKCLKAASEHGEVIIITNSDDGWVKFSAERFVPNLLPVLSKYRIVSARTRYERFYPNQPLCWKAAAFAHEVNEIFTSFEGDNDKEESYKEDDPCDRSSVGSIDSDTMNTSCDSLVSTDYSSDGSSSTPRHSTPPLSSRGSSSSQSRRRRREVISFGDSMEERTAVKIVSGQLSSVSKSVMFINNPTPLQLIGQLTMLTGHMKFVCEHQSSLDLEISPSQAQKCAESFMERNKMGEINRATSKGFPRIRRSVSTDFPSSPSALHKHPTD